MELEEMKSLWLDMSNKINNQQILTDKLIMDITKEKYRNKFSGLIGYETLGASVCFGLAILLFANFGKLDTWYLLASGLFSAAYFIVLPFAVLKSLYNIRNVNLSSNSYKQTLIDFAKRKRQLLFVQQIGIGFNFLLVLLCLPVAVKILDGKDLFMGSQVWWWYIPISTIALYFFSRWGYACYQRMAQSAESVLNELE